MQDLYQLVTDRIVAALEAGTPPWVRPWNADTDPVPMNAETRRLVPRRQLPDARHRGPDPGLHPELLAHLSPSDSPRRTGAQGRTRHARGVLEATHRERPRRETAARHPAAALLHRVQHGADRRLAACTMAQPLPSVPAWQSDDVAELLIDASGADIRHGGSKAFYTPGDDYIQLPPRATFAHASGYYATTLHELVHWTGHALPAGPAARRALRRRRLRRGGADRRTRLGVPLRALPGRRPAAARQLRRQLAAGPAQRQAGDLRRRHQGAERGRLPAHP